MRNLLICGAGKIGGIIAALLANSNDYQVFLVDKKLKSVNPELKHHQYANLSLHELDITSQESAAQFIAQHAITAIVSCLPYSLSSHIAELAKQTQCHYFDLTEDIDSVSAINKIAKNAKQAFVSQCGLAPGFINIVANEILKKFSKPIEAKLRCGALPQNVSNALQYAITWSLDGLINEYGNPCQAIVNGKLSRAAPLEDLEEIQIDGLTYEAFNTSGGIASLVDAYQGKIETLNYKTIRYPGHCEKMRFIMEGLKLNEDRDTLKRILENAIPSTKQDVVIVYVSVKGEMEQQFMREAYVKKFYPMKLADIDCSAIQACTASGACAVIDIVLSNENKYHGRICQEHFTLNQLYENRFGKIFK